jgi:lipoate-protein ligase A
VTLSCHILTYEISSGPVNMALDEALLDRVASQPDAAFLRTYGWSNPTLSLGYFQSQCQATAEARWRSVPMVRRATGGGAIWHHHEVTYAVVLPAHHRLARPSTALYQTVHAAILDVLRAQGLSPFRRASSEPAPEQPGDASSRPPFLCFTDRDPEDIVTDGFKVVGSAQRRRAGAILQHGSILLRQSDRTPELRGVCDLADVPEDPRFWSGPIERGIMMALDLAPAPLDPPAYALLRYHALDLEQTVYGDPAWTARR